MVEAGLAGSTAASRLTIGHPRTVALSHGASRVRSTEHSATLPRRSRKPGAAISVPIALMRSVQSHPDYVSQRGLWVGGAEQWSFFGISPSQTQPTIS